MTEPSQLTIDGRETPTIAPETVDPPRSYAAAPLFTAPQTIRGQLAMPTDRKEDISGVLPKGKRTNGHYVNGRRVLVSRGGPR